MLYAQCDHILMDFFASYFAAAAEPASFFSLSMIAFSNINAKIFNISKQTKKHHTKKANIQHFHLQSSICFLRTDRVLYQFFLFVCCLASSSVIL